MPEISLNPLQNLGIVMPSMESLQAIMLYGSIGFVTLIAIVVILWKTKWYKKILYSYPITVLYWDQREEGTPIQMDKMRHCKDRGIEVGEMFSRGEKIPWPSLSEFKQVGKKIFYLAHRLETGVWLPVKFEGDIKMILNAKGKPLIAQGKLWEKVPVSLGLAKPTAKIVSELKDMKFSTNLKNVLDRDTRQRYMSKDFLTAYMPHLLLLAAGIAIMLILYAQYNYVWLPMSAKASELLNQPNKITVGECYNLTQPVNSSILGGPAPYIPPGA